MLTESQQALLRGFPVSELFQIKLIETKMELVKRLNYELTAFDNQVKAAAFLGTTQSRVSHLMRLNVEGISLDSILEYLSKFEIILSFKYSDGKLFFSVE